MEVGQAITMSHIRELGVLLTTEGNKRVGPQVPNAHVFDDLGGAAMGVWGRRLTYCTVYLTILGEPIIFHLTSMEALQQIFYQSHLSQGLAAAIVAVVMLPLGQVGRCCLCPVGS